MWFVFLGAIVGLAGAVWVHATGAPIWAAALAYPVIGLATVLVAALAYFAARRDPGNHAEDTAKMGSLGPHSAPETDH